MKKLKPLYLYFKDSLTPCKTIFDNMHQQFWCKQLQEPTGYPDDESVAPLNLWAITFIRTVTLQVAWYLTRTYCQHVAINISQSVLMTATHLGQVSLQWWTQLSPNWLYFGYISI